MIRVMNTILIDSIKFIDSLTIILDELVISPERRNTTRNKIITSLINAESFYTLKLTEIPPVEENYNPLNGHEVFLTAFIQNLIDSNIWLEKTRYENTIKLGIFSDALKKNPSMKGVINNYKYMTEELIKEGILS